MWNILNYHISVPVFAGGRSYGCPGNSGAAGTFYDTLPRRLTVSNHNLSTETDTLLMEFPYQPLWTNVYIKYNAKATAPLLWSRMQVIKRMMPVSYPNYFFRTKFLLVQNGPSGGCTNIFMPCIGW